MALATPAGRFRRPLAAAAAVALVVGSGVLALSVYGATGTDRIASGTTAAGVDLGGMTTEQARAALAHEAGARVRAPVVVRAAGRMFRLSGRTIRARLEAAAMAQAALAASRKGGTLERGARRVLGVVERTSVAARVTWSQAAVAAFVRRVARAVDRPTRNAAIRVGRRGLRRIPARTGREVQRATLTGAIAAQLASARDHRAIAAPVRRARPPTRTLADLKARNPWIIAVIRPTKELRLYHRLRLQRTYRIAVGAIGFDTAAGRYEIENKVVDPAWNVPREAWAGGLAGRVIPPGDPQNPLEARWMGFHDGEGIHGTADIASLGSAASHGCIRMSVPDVENLFRKVRVHTPVFIV